MLNLGNRFAEYGVTGGFFVFIQLLAALYAAPEAAKGLLATLNGQLPEAKLSPTALTALDGLLVALALVSVFFVGLLLDLVGTALPYWETKTFRRHVRTNGAWLLAFVGKRLPGDALTALRSIVSTFTHGPRGIGDVARMLALWRPEARQSAASVLSRSREPAIAHSAFRRIESYLVAEALQTASSASADWLGEQLRLCRMSRAIAISLFLLALELGLYLAGSDVFSRDPMAVLLHPAALAYLACLAGAAFVTWRAYSRFCMTLFAILHVRWRADESPLPRAAESSVASAGGSVAAS